MPRRSARAIIGDVLALPWWVSIVAAAIVYLLVGLMIPLLFAGDDATNRLGRAALDYGWLLALLFALPAPFAAYRRHARSKLLDTHTDLEGIRNLHWQDFEKLVAEAFSRIGYAVTTRSEPKSASAVDLIATTSSERILVQCKHWRAAMVGVAAVGDLVESIAREGATGGAVVTSGTFSEDALAYATGKPIQLIDGAQLEQLVISVRRRTT